MSDDRESLIEAAASPFRQTAADGEIQSAPAWHDLDEEGRREAFERSLVDRRLASALDPSGLSPTARAVLQKIKARDTQ